MQPDSKVKYKISAWWYSDADGKRGYFEEPRESNGRFDGSEKKRLYISISQNPRAEPLPRRFIELIRTRILERIPENMTLMGIVDENGQDLLAPEDKI